MEEVWKDVIGYEGLYQVSNKGNVKSLIYKRQNGNASILKLVTKNNGYIQVTLVKDEYKSIQVHRLVAQMFIPNPENKPQVNHINGIRNDNRVENLEWVTASENQIHSHRILGNKSGYWMRDKIGALSVRKKLLIQKDLNGNIIRYWHCASDVSRELGYSGHAVRLCCRGVTKTSHGFVWQYDKAEREAV